MKYGDTNIIQRISRQDKSCEEYRHILLVDGRVLFQTLRYYQQKESLGLQGLSNRELQASDCKSPFAGIKQVS